MTLLHMHFRQILIQFVGHEWSKSLHFSYKKVIYYKLCCLISPGVVC